MSIFSLAKYLNLSGIDRFVFTSNLQVIMSYTNFVYLNKMKFSYVGFFLLNFPSFDPSNAVTVGVYKGLGTDGGKVGITYIFRDEGISILV